jgi:hypothetical protein
MLNCGVCQRRLVFNGRSGVVKRAGPVGCGKGHLVKTFTS